METQCGFPQCIGAVDGTHLPILAPLECANDYYNRKGFHSVIMQAVADHRCCFANIFIGWPGSLHNARVFKNSDFYRKGLSRSCDPTAGRIINGECPWWFWEILHTHSFPG